MESDPLKSVSEYSDHWFDQNRKSEKNNTKLHCVSQKDKLWNVFFNRRKILKLSS